MPRPKVWTKEKVDTEILPLIEEGWSIVEISRTKDISRQRLYKIIGDLKDSESDGERSK